MNLEHPIAPVIDAAGYSWLMAMQKGDEGRTPEEEAALELLTMLIGQFEEVAYSFRKFMPRRHHDAGRGVLTPRGIDHG